MGDMDSSDQWLSSNELILVSTEKLDSLIRHGADWIVRVGCIVFDEVHMLGDPSRGPTLELLMTKLASTTSAQLLALSATVGNAGEISQWLKARLVESDYRPVSLRKGIAFDGKIYYAPAGSKKAIDESLLGTSKGGEARVVEDTLERQKQVLIFYSTRRNAEAGAHRLSLITRAKLSEQELQKLEKVASSITDVLERPTTQCLDLAALVKSGTAFHHAGLMNAQRGIIENAFKSNVLKAICSTTTLGMGVNMPAHTVLVRDTSRYSGGSGSGSISINEVLQLMGRAGRPKYDTEGRALISASTREKVEELKNRYLLSEPEPIDSGLGVAAMMRSHILAFIASDFLNTPEAIKRFIGKTFYAFQYGNAGHIYSVVENVLEDLKGWEMITSKGEALQATRIGKRVSDLYIDPLSARWIITCLQNETDLIGNLYMISNTMEMRPYPKPPGEAYEGYVLYKHMVRRSALLYDTDMHDFGYYDPVAPFATAMMLNEWIDEKREDELMRKYRITPGHIYTKLASADWMLYSAIELAHLIKKSPKDIIDLRVRVHYGIKEELLDLVRLEQIGRVRARRLYMNGIRRVSQIAENREKVVSLLGSEIAQKVFKQIGL